MLGPFSGREGKNARKGRRACACPENHGGLDVYGIDAFFPIAPGACSLAAALDKANAAANLAWTVEQAFRVGERREVDELNGGPGFLDLVRNRARDNGGIIPHMEKSMRRDVMVTLALVALSAGAGDVTRYGAKIVKATLGETVAPTVEVPAPWRVLDGDDALTGLDARDWYFTIEAPGAGLPPPRVEATWPGVAVKCVVGAKDVMIEDGRVSFTPTAWKAPTHFSSHWREQAVFMGIFHNVPGVQHGPYAGKPYPAAEAAAQNNWLLASRDMFLRAGFDRPDTADGAAVNLYGFESNFPNGHVDHPPHFHVMLMWNRWHDNNVGHYHLDGKGLIVDNSHMVQGNVPGRKAGTYSQNPGETTDYIGPSGRVVFSVEMLADGTGIVLHRPGVPAQWRASSKNPVSFVDVSRRDGPDAPWVDVERVSVADDSVGGVLTITKTVGGRTETEVRRYNPDTGVMERK